MATGIPIDGNVIDTGCRFNFFRNLLVEPTARKVGETVFSELRGLVGGVALYLWIRRDRQLVVVLEYDLEIVRAVIAHVLKEDNRNEESRGVFCEFLI